jgi:hypothetical protein
LKDRAAAQYGPNDGPPLVESIATARREEEEVHHAVKDSFEYLCEDLMRAWLGQEQRYEGNVFFTFSPVSRFDDMIHEIWMTATARRKATWEAWVMASTSGCTNPFAGEGASSMIQTHQVALETRRTLSSYFSFIN